MYHCANPSAWRNCREVNYVAIDTAAYNCVEIEHTVTNYIFMIVLYDMA
jgi:hypothetical protein